MRSMYSMDTIQIEVTNYCINECANCTRFCGHHKEPYHMGLDMFKEAVDSMVGFPQMVGIMGGEPLLHPEFERLCEYALSKIPKERLGLWTCLPEGFEEYRTTICKTFGNIFLNDHTRDDIYHCPVLVASQEVIPKREDIFIVADNCWLQNSWSAAINPKGAFFCEIAASLSLLFDGPRGWKVEPNWWKRVVKDYAEQVNEWCPQCGCAVPLKRRRSIDLVDDVSPGMLEKLRGISKRVDAGKYAISDLKVTSINPQMAAYKDMKYRQRMAARYGMSISVTDRGFLEPFLRDETEGKPIGLKQSLLSAIREEVEQ